MSTQAVQAPPSPIGSRWTVPLSCAAVVLAAVLAYHNSLSGPFVFDDVPSIPGNPTILHLWPPGPLLSPPPGVTVSGRPVLNLSLAVNHALGGEAVAGYHALNLLIHALAGLALFGILRRTLGWPVLHRRFGAVAAPLALAAAVVWTVHPLQTESVTYIVQRAESLMGLFYLLTLYAFIRGVESPAPLPWFAASVASCLLGMGTKEVMVSAPIMVLLYDRAFVAGTFREAWRRRRGCYLGLAGTWLLLGYLVASTGGNRGGSTVGLGVGVSEWAYGLTQFRAIVHYLGLSFWPHPLAFDYGVYRVGGAGEVIPQALVVIPLLAGTVVAQWRWPSAGFLGAWFFLILAPTSLVPGTTQMIAEHRMYLPLAAVVVPVVLGAHILAGRRSLAVLFALALGLGWMTSARNADYRSGLSIWRDTAEKRPGNALAHNNLGTALLAEGRRPEALAQFQVALRLDPGAVEAHNNAGNALVLMGRSDEALGQYREALRLRTDYAPTYVNLGSALEQLGRDSEALHQFKKALELKPDGATWAAAGKVEARLEHPEEALRDFQRALVLRPEDADAQDGLGAALEDLGRTDEAMASYLAELRIRPNSPQAHYNVGVLLLDEHQPASAGSHFRAAVEGQPDFEAAYEGLGMAATQLKRPAEAVDDYRQAVRIEPNNAQAHYLLGYALLHAGHFAEALVQWKATERIDPGFPGLARTLAKARAVPAEDAR